MPPHLYHQVYLTTDSRRSDPLLKKPGAASPLASRQNTLRSCDPVFYRQVLGAESAPLDSKPRPTLTGVSLKPRDPARADPKMGMKPAPGPTTSSIQRCCKP